MGKMGSGCEATVTLGSGGIGSALIGVFGVFGRAVVGAGPSAGGVNPALDVGAGLRLPGSTKMLVGIAPSFVDADCVTPPPGPVAEVPSGSVGGSALTSFDGAPVAWLSADTPAVNWLWVAVEEAVVVRGVGETFGAPPQAAIVSPSSAALHANWMVPRRSPKMIVAPFGYSLLLAGLAGV